MKLRAAIVRIDGQPVGTLREQGREILFQYDSAWIASPQAVPVSLTLPLRAAPYVSNGLHPFFENLLPEGWLLELATKKLKVAKDDAFDAAEADGGDDGLKRREVAVDVREDGKAHLGLCGG